MVKQCLITHLGQRKFSKVRCLRNVRLELIYIVKLNKQNIPATQMVVFLFTLISFILALLILPNFAALSEQISVKILPIFAQLFTFLFLALKSMLFWLWEHPYNVAPPDRLRSLSHLTAINRWLLVKLRRLRKNIPKMTIRGTLLERNVRRCKHRTGKHLKKRPKGGILDLEAIFTPLDVVLSVPRSPSAKRVLFSFQMLLYVKHCGLLKSCSLK